ncbi:MAG: hypothetical protein ACI9KE_002847 [Polyangiales bacterium]|jgi:hypothetical protein
MSKKSLTLSQRAFLKAYNPIFGRFLGWRQDTINEEFVRTYGVIGLMRFGKNIGDAIAFLSEKYGEARAQHLVGFAGMMNGCRFCGVGHNLTANILIFKETGALFPIDEQEIPDLQQMEDPVILGVFQERLAATEWTDLLSLIERMEQLRLGATRSDSDDDLYLGLALDLWAWNNECTIDTGFDIDPKDVPSFTRFDKDRALYKRYRNARGSL